MTTPFNEDYFLRGQETGVSNYSNYEWRPELTIPACKSIIRYLGIREGDSLLDFGCSRGYYCRAYRELGITAFGYDVSRWAIENCDPSVASYVTCKGPMKAADWIVAKDVLEHVIYKDLKATIRFFMFGVRKAALICVPLTTEDGGSYILDVDNKDATHVIRWPFSQWLEFLQQIIDDESFPFVVSGSHRLPGLKECGALKHNGCGFFVLRRYHHEV